MVLWSRLRPVHILRALRVLRGTKPQRSPGTAEKAAR